MRQHHLILSCMWLRGRGCCKRRGRGMQTFAARHTENRDKHRRVRCLMDDPPALSHRERCNVFASSGFTLTVWCARRRRRRRIVHWLPTARTKQQQRRQQPPQPKTRQHRPQRARVNATERSLSVRLGAVGVRYYCGLLQRALAGAAAAAADGTDHSAPHRSSPAADRRVVCSTAVAVSPLAA
jgi:hypothetical protein